MNKLKLIYEKGSEIIEIGKASSNEKNAKEYINGITLKTIGNASKDQVFVNVPVHQHDSEYTDFYFNEIILGQNKKTETIDSGVYQIIFPVIILLMVSLFFVGRFTERGQINHQS